MKKATFIAATMFAGCAFATPSPNNFHAVTNDWYNGNFSNVYELAQMRLAANSNDLVAANILVEHAVAFADFTTMSNSIVRLIRISDLATSTAYTNIYWRERSGWLWYLNEYLPAQDDAHRMIEQQKSHLPHKEMISFSLLKALFEDGNW